MLANLPGGAGRGPLAAEPCVAGRQTDCRGAGAAASPLSPSAGGEASSASWNDIGRSANQARGCSWSCHLQEETHTRLGRAPPPVWKGLCKCTFLSVHLLGLKTVMRAGSSIVKLETKTAGRCLPAPGLRATPGPVHGATAESGPWDWSGRGEASFRSPHAAQPRFPEAGARRSAEGRLHQSGEVCRPLVSYGRDTIDMQVTPPLRLLGRRRSRPPRASVRPGTRENAPTRLSWRTPRPRQLCPGTRSPDKPRKPRKCYSIPCLSQASMSRSPACQLLMRHVQTSPLEFS